jgi:hypothetical protein
MGDDSLFAAKLKSFQDDLLRLSLKDVVRKHISTGQPYAFTEDEYFELRRVIALEFKLHPSEVVVVGSSRTGFSLDPDNRYRELRPKADVDVAIVSPKRFDEYWELVFQYAQTDVAWPAKDFKNRLFNGWIDPRFLPNSTSFIAARKWAEFFDGLMQSPKYGRRTITARLYRSWERLEAYQESSVRACEQAIRSTR